MFWTSEVSLNEKYTERRNDIDQTQTDIIVLMPFQILHTIMYFTPELGIHILVHRVDFGIVAPVHLFSSTERPAVAHKHFGNNDLTCRQNITLNNLLHTLQPHHQS